MEHDYQIGNITTRHPLLKKGNIIEGIAKINGRVCSYTTICETSIKEIPEDIAIIIEDPKEASKIISDLEKTCHASVVKPHI